LIHSPESEAWAGGYLGAVIGAFGIDVDYAQLVKHYGPTPDAAGPERKYSPGECCGISKHRLLGQPIKALVSTSYVEKHNQTMRQHMKRFSRLTAAHSKKIDNHVHMVAPYTCWYNFARISLPNKRMLINTMPHEIKARLTAAGSLRARAASYSNLGKKCHNREVAETVEILARELYAAAESLESVD